MNQKIEKIGLKKVEGMNNIYMYIITYIIYVELLTTTINFFLHSLANSPPTVRAAHP